jgi:hypothetical protein
MKTSTESDANAFNPSHLLQARGRHRLAIKGCLLRSDDTVSVRHMPPSYLHGGIATGGRSAENSATNPPRAFISVKSC